jgi:PAS domain S-box-containing protein
VRKRIRKNIQADVANGQSVVSSCEKSAISQAHRIRETCPGQEQPPEADGKGSFVPSPDGAVSYLRAMFLHTSDSMIVLDEGFLVCDVNPVACKALGLRLDTVIGCRCPEVLGCQNLNHMQLCGTSSCPLTRALEQQGSLPNEELLLGTHLESPLEASVNVTPVAINGRRGVMLNARDLSALKVANRVRSNFVSMVSHELRTPLNSVHGFIDLLLQGHMGALTDEQQTYLGYTQEGVNQLISIVEDILFMTRSDLGQFEIKRQEVPLHTLVQQVIRTFQLQALKAEVILSYDVVTDLPLLSADPQRLKQVLNNLVANAIKFTPPGGTVTVSARREDSTFVKVFVKDTGYGIPVEDRQHIFERFYQSNHSMQSKMGGYGLGLSIAKLIVEQHGGTIGFDTVVNRGTKFYFMIPFCKK